MVEDRPSAESSFGNLLWLLLGRQVVLILSAGILLLREWGNVLSPVFGPAYVFLLACSVPNIAFTLLVWLRRRCSASAFSVNVAVDIVIVSVLVYLTGGVGSHFTPLFFAVILVAVFFVSPRAGILTASVCSVVLSSISLAYFFNFHYGLWLPFVHPSWGIPGAAELSFVLPFLAAHGMAFFAVAVLGCILAGSMKQARLMTDEILQNMADGVVALNRHGVVVYVNPVASRLLGMEDRGARPMVSVEELFSDDRHRELREILCRGMDGVTEVTLLKGGEDGGTPVMVRTSRVLDAKGRMRGVVAIMEDLTLQRELERMRMSVNRMEAVSEVMAGIPHQLRNPLASIKGALQEVLASGGLDESDRRLLSLAVSEADRINCIINDFLQFGRERQLRLESVDVGGLLEEIAAELRARDGSDGVEVTVNAPSGVNCECDRELMKQALLNVGVNALEALSGEGALRIGVYRSRRMTDGVLIIFEDTGPGIPPENRRKIFEPFWSTKSGGTGLGLALTARIINVHGGMIDVRNRRGGGAVFEVWLPSHPPSSR